MFAGCKKDGFYIDWVLYCATAYFTVAQFFRELVSAKMQLNYFVILNDSFFPFPLSTTR